MDRLRAWLLRTLRVPPKPVIPPDAGEIQVFRAGQGYYRYRLLLWLAGQIGAFLSLATAFFWLGRFQPGQAEGILASITLFIQRLTWFGYVLQIPLSFAIVRLDFDMRWYILSDRSLRIREGIVTLREKTMTFANIQQITVRQNPVQRLFGISDVQVRSAGGGADEGSGGGKGIGESMHEAWFRGVDDAETIRSALRDRVRTYGDSGLGDLDELPTRAPLGSSGALAAARELLEETTLLRRQLDRGQRSG